MRIEPACVVLRKKLTEMLDVPGIRERRAIIHSQAYDTGARYDGYLEGALPLRGEFIHATPIEDAAKDEVPHFKFSCAYTSLVVPFEGLMVAGSSDCSV